MTYETRAWIERIERLWQNQNTFFPSISEERYKFPKSIDYYRYLGENQLAENIEKLRSIHSGLREDINQITKTLDWCYMMTPDRFKDLLLIIPWILTAQKDAFYLRGYHNKIEDTYIPEGYNRDMVIEALQSQRRIYDNQIRHVDESIEAIKFVVSRQPKPAPLISMRKSSYEEGEIVVGYYNSETPSRRTSPYLIMVADSSIGIYHMAVRPLTDEELEHRPVDLPTTDFQEWMNRADYSWVMPLQSYQYYLEHPGLAKEHIEVFEKSGFGYKLPVSLKVLASHFQNL